MYEDNTACIEWGNTVIGGRERAKHIDIHKHFAHEVIRNGEMKLIKVSTTSLTSSPRDSICHSSKPVSTASSEWTRTSSLKGPLSSRGGGSLRLPESSHVGPSEGCFACSTGGQGPSKTSTCIMTIRVPRLGYGTGDQVRWLTAPDARFAVGSWTLDTSFYSERNSIKRGREE